MWTPVCMEPPLGYHPCGAGFLTRGREPVWGQCQVGSLTGAVASERVSEAPKGSLRMVGNHSKSAKAEGSLTATPTGGAGTKVGLSDPVEFKWECHRSTDKSYPGHLNRRRLLLQLHVMESRKSCSMRSFQRWKKPVRLMWHLRRWLLWNV